MHKRLLNTFSTTIFSVFVMLFITACSDDDEASVAQILGSSNVVLPTAGSEAAAFTINTSGGNGGTAAGGTGGAAMPVSIDLINPIDGRLEILDNGLADASFTLSTLTADFGSNVLTISADTTITVEASKPAVDTAYMVNGDKKLYVATDSTTFPDTAEIVTGLDVETGATLTLALNIGGTDAELQFSNDVRNSGVITTAEGAGTSIGDLNLWMHNYLGTGNVTTAGNSSTKPDAGTITLKTDDTLINSGIIDASGFDDAAAGGGNGGDGNTVVLNVSGFLENTGQVNASGGDAAGVNSDGGAGANVTLASNYGHLHNEGDVLSSGGDGDRLGGSAGAITLKVNVVGELLNAGALDSSGGIGLQNNGGAGNAVILSSSGGGLISSGALTTSGGGSADGFTGGNAGNINISTLWGDFETPPGNMIVSGNLLLQGGAASGASAGTGGTGGTLTLTANDGAADFESTQYKQLLGLWGYSAITLAGGTGATPAAGSNFFATVSPPGAVNVETWANNSMADIVNEVSINTAGASSTAADTGASVRGGAGGDIVIGIDSLILGDDSSLDNSGALTTMSGNNQNSATTRASGDVMLMAPGNVMNSAAIDTSGGNDTSTANANLASSTTPVVKNGAASGNDAGSIEFLSSTGSITNTGALASNGGSAEVVGGDAGFISMSAMMVDNSANVSANGGASTVLPLTESKGGAADVIIFRAKTQGGLVNTGTLTNENGAGTIVSTNNGDRQRMIDGF